MRVQTPCFYLDAVGGVFIASLFFADRLQAQDASASAGSSRDADRRGHPPIGALTSPPLLRKATPRPSPRLWTEQGEYESDDGTILVGRSAIEAAFAAHFKDRPAEKMEIKVEDIRFPSRDTAVEEGLTCTTASDMLPDSAKYRVLHVREDGKWQIALCREWAPPRTAWPTWIGLFGTWRGQAKDQEMVISFAREKDRPFIVGEFAATAAGKTVPLGTMKIGLDPLSRKFMSWHFDPDGGYGHGVWLREGKHWAVDSHGVQGDGAQTAAVNVLSRFGSDELGWGSIDRMVGGKAAARCAADPTETCRASK